MFEIEIKSVDQSDSAVEQQFPSRLLKQEWVAVFNTDFILVKIKHRRAYD
jgi:hypothetical protein